MAANFSGNPNSLLTYSAPSTKWVQLSTGLYASGTTLRTSYEAGVAKGLLIEGARTNRALYCRDLTNAAWTKTNTTAAKDQTGIDGVANSASKLTATAGNGTALQSITSASASRVFSVFLKRVTGTGNIDITMDNGTSWTACTLTSSWSRFSVPNATSTNPIVGFRIVTSGDAIAVDFAQEETGAAASSPIETTSATVTRAGDTITIATSLFAHSETAGTILVKSIIYGSANYGSDRIAEFNDGTVNERVFLYPASINAGSALVTDGGATQAAPPATSASAFTVGTAFKIGTSWAANSFRVALNGTAATEDTAGTLPTITTLRFGSGAGGVFSSQYMQQLVHLPRQMSQVELNTWTTL